MMKHLFMSLGLTLIFSTTVFAQDVGDKFVLKVLMRDGTAASYPLPEKPVITYSGSDMIVTAPNGKFSYNRGQVKELRFDNSISGIDVADTETINVVINGGVVTVNGIEDARGIKVMDIQSREMSAPMSQMDGQSVKVDLSGLSKNIYIVVIPNHQPIKIITK